MTKKEFLYKFSDLDDSTELVGITAAGDECNIDFFITENESGEEAIGVSLE